MPSYHPPPRRESPRPNEATRRLYRTKRWFYTRQAVLAEFPLCEDCRGVGRVTPATDVHHRQKHHGDLSRFFDRGNLGSLCQSCHARRTQRGE